MPLIGSFIRNTENSKSLKKLMILKYDLSCHYNNKQMSSNNLHTYMKSHINQQELMECTPPPKRHHQQRGSVKQKTQCHLMGVTNLSRHRSTMNSRTKIQKCNVSPARSIVTNEDQFKEMQQVILSENNNLKQHNTFLKNQIELMFDRERQYKKHLLLNKQKIKELQCINKCMQQHIHTLVSNFVQEISKIQTLLEQQRSESNVLSHSNVFVTNKKYEEDASQTQSTIHKDLQDLKTKVKQIYQNFQHLQLPQFKEDNPKSTNRYTPYFKQESNLQKYIPQKEQLNKKQDLLFTDLPGTLVKRKKNLHQRPPKNMRMIK